MKSLIWLSSSNTYMALMLSGTTGVWSIRISNFFIFHPCTGWKVLATTAKESANVFCFLGTVLILKALKPSIKFQTLCRYCPKRISLHSYWSLICRTTSFESPITTMFSTFFSNVILIPCMRASYFAMLHVQGNSSLKDAWYFFLFGLWSSMLAPLPILDLEPSNRSVQHSLLDGFFFVEVEAWRGSWVSFGLEGLVRSKQCTPRPSSTKGYAIGLVVLCDWISQVWLTKYFYLIGNPFPWKPKMLEVCGPIAIQGAWPIPA